MGKILHAIEVGYELLTAIETVIAGGVGTFEFSWKGRTFIVNVTPKA